MTRNEFMDSILKEIGFYYDECENSILEETDSYYEKNRVIEAARNFPQSYINSDENL